MTLAYVGLGSNLSHPRRQLARAVRELRRIPRTHVVAVSPSYRTAPLGASTAQPDFINAVAAVQTSLSPRALLERLLSIEQRHKRERPRGVRNAPRTLDLDLLLFGRRRMGSTRLTLPHPRMHERAFVLKPLADLAASAVVPGHGPVQSLLRRVAGQRVARFP